MRRVKRTARLWVAFVVFAVAGVVGAGAETVELTVESGDATLAGALYLPRGKGPFPAVVLTHGSEAGHRKLQGYIRWAERLRDRGLAVLVFDKRGVGDSTGDYVEAPDLSVPAADVLAWVAKLAPRVDIRKDRIGVLGWSQGGWVGPLAASRSKDIAFVVSISGPGVSPLEQNIFDKTNQFRRTGASKERVAQFSRVLRLVWTYITDGTGRGEAQQAWDAAQGQAWFDAAYNGPPLMDRDRLLKHPRMQHYVAHQSHAPGQVLQQVHVPLLAVFGGDDSVVPVEASVTAMKAALARAKNDRFTYRIFPGGDHGVAVAGPDGRRMPAPGFHDFVLDWLVQTTR